MHRVYLPVYTVFTLAGSGAMNYADGTGDAAKFNYPFGIVVDADGNLYVADASNDRIRKITATGEVTTVAGSTRGYREGAVDDAQFNNPYGIAVDVAGNLYVADGNNHGIRKITPDGVVTTFAGGGQGYGDGTGAAAQFYYPYGVTVGAAGNLYVADTRNSRIRKITPAAVVTNFAGSKGGYIDGTGNDAQFDYPYSIAVDAAGNLYVTDGNNHRIRKVTAAGVVTTLAGSTGGYADGVGDAAKFNNPFGIAMDAVGNLYVADEFNHRIRKITSAGVVSTVAGSGAEGSVDGAVTAAQFNRPFGIAVDAAGNLYVADTFNHRIRKITAE